MEIALSTINLYFPLHGKPDVRDWACKCNMKKKICKRANDYKRQPVGGNFFHTFFSFLKNYLNHPHLPSLILRCLLRYFPRHQTHHLMARKSPPLAHHHRQPHSERHSKVFKAEDMWVIKAFSHSSTKTWNYFCQTQPIPFSFHVQSSLKAFSKSPLLKPSLKAPS